MICVTSGDTIRTLVVGVIGQLFVMLLVGYQLSLDVTGWEDLPVIGVFQSIFRSKVCTCIVEYVRQYCDRVNQCVADVINESIDICKMHEVVGIGLLVSVGLTHAGNPLRNILSDIRKLSILALIIRLGY